MMKYYTVKELSKLAGVSIKTLHLYDELGQMAHEEIYEGLPKEFGSTYRNESIQNWGNDFNKSENYLKKLSKKNREELFHKMKTSWSLLFNLKEEKIDSKKVQEEIGNFFQIIKEIWGKKDSKDDLKNQFKGLGELYTLDERYTLIEGKAYPEFARFMKDSIDYFVRKN